MLPRGGSSSRAARGQPQIRSRGRGHGSASRGASSSSSKSKHSDLPPKAPRALQDSSNLQLKGRQHSRHRVKKSYSNFRHTGSEATPNGGSTFEKERLENAAQREARGHSLSGAVGRNSRGYPRGPKHVRFAELPEVVGSGKENPTNNPLSAFAQSSSPPSTNNVPAFNPFAQPAQVGAPSQSQRLDTWTSASSSNPFAQPRKLEATSSFQALDTSMSASSFNPFAQPHKLDATSPFQKLDAPKSASPFNPFAQPHKLDATSPFQKLDAPKSSSSFNPFAQAHEHKAPSHLRTQGSSKSTSSPNPFAQVPTTRSSKLSHEPRTPSPALPFTTSTPASTKSSPYSFTTAQPAVQTPADTLKQPQESIFGAPSGPFKTTALPPSSSHSSRSFGSPSQPPNNRYPKKKPLSDFSSSTSLPTTSKEGEAIVASGVDISSDLTASSSLAAKKIDQLLEKERIVTPAWPSNPGDPAQKPAVEALWHASKVYRDRVRASLVRGGLLDDPDKPKKLSDAVEFKGTYEGMCPDYEKLTRINERNVSILEKELASNGKDMWPSTRKMVKALARSAAGQEAPLPMDVRSPAALRRTVDYLLHEVLGEEGDLTKVHGFLWDRTRAIRRDFVFQSSMNVTELRDQINCLERISRFHAVSLHLMSQAGVDAESFVEQQEVEQLGKALLSLIHTYDDCKAQGVTCENESEFRAYYVLFYGKNEGILEVVQDWGWNFWGESEQIRIAVDLVEALQNITKALGPLKPPAATDIAQNAYSRFFSIVESRQVSYTMACFAEIHFNTVRKLALKTIYASYRKQRDQTKDWTLEKLNLYLKFDHAEEIIEFAEAHGLRFEQNEDDEDYLVLDCENQIDDPFPPLKQGHSYMLVERKRGNHSLPEVIDTTVFEADNDEMTRKEPGDLVEANLTDEDGDLFVEDNWKSSASGVNTSSEEESDLDDNDRENATSIFFPPGTQKIEQPIPTTTNTSASKSVLDSVSNPKQASKGFFAYPALTNNMPTELKITPPAPSSIFAKQSTEIPSIVFQSQAGQEPLKETPSLFPCFRSAVPSNIPEDPKVAEPLDQQSTSLSISKSAPTSCLGQITTTQPIAPSFQSSTVTTPTQNPDITSQSTLETQASATPTVVSPAYVPRTTTPVPSASGPPVPFSTSPPRPSITDDEVMEQLSVFMFNGRRGLMDHFVENTLEKLLRPTAWHFVVEEELRKSNEEADEYRKLTLSTKYFKGWQRAAHNIWVRRQGREARKARRELAESIKNSKTAQSNQIVEEFSASTGSNKARSSLDNQLLANGFHKGVNEPGASMRSFLHDERPGRVPRSTSNRSRATSSPGPKTNKILKHRPENKRRLSIFSDPSYLSGASRIHVMPNYTLADEKRKQVSGVKTDYFRLKARGIMTLPDGTPLARTAAVTDILHGKRILGPVTKSSTPSAPRASTYSSRVSSDPIEQSGQPEISQPSKGHADEAIQAIKARAKALMKEEMKPQEPQKQKRAWAGDDEDLFARAKRIRERMDEGAQWFREEIKVHSRSVS